MAEYPKTQTVGQTSDGRANILRAEYGGRVYTRECNKGYTSYLEVNADGVYWRSYPRNGGYDFTLEVASPD